MGPHLTKPSRSKTRLRSFEISEALLLRLFSKGNHEAYEVTENPIPDDATVHMVQRKHEGRIGLLLESKEFEWEEFQSDGRYPALKPVISEYEINDEGYPIRNRLDVSREDDQ